MMKQVVPEDSGMSVETIEKHSIIHEIRLFFFKEKEPV